MTVEERLLFIRAGYSAQDIAGFEAAESAAEPAPAADPKPAAEPAPAADPKPAEEPAPAADPKPAAEMPAWAAALQKSLDDLTKATQAANARFDDMGDPLTIQQEAENALAEYLTGTNPAKAPVNTKTHSGGKRK